MDNELFEKAERLYSDNQSLKLTAQLLDISRSKLRKILITRGLITSEITDKALQLLKQGKSQKEIAEELKVSNATLSTYLPYGNRIYNKENKSKNALRIEKYRSRQVVLEKKQIINNFQKEKRK